MIQAQVKTFDGRLPWLKGKQKYIGSSDAPTILGCGYAGHSKTTVWDSKVNDVKPVVDPQILLLMEEGRRCEPFVISRFEMEHPDWKVERGTPFDLTICKDHPYLASSLDAEVIIDGEKLPLEAKWIHRHMAREWDDDQTPLKYQVQLMHQLICTGAKRGCVAAFVAGHYIERWIERDEDVIEWMIGQYQEFWSYVIDRTPPPDSSPVAFRTLRPEPEYGVAKIAGGRLSSSIREYLEMDSKAIETRAKADKLKNRIATDLSDCEYLILDDESSVKITRNCIKPIRRLPRGVEIK